MAVGNHCAFPLPFKKVPFTLEAILFSFPLPLKLVSLAFLLLPPQASVFAL